MKTVCEFTNMVMLTEGTRVLVQRRRLYWKGIAFPGGHVEAGESFTESARREVEEETGLRAENLTLCGTVNWENLDTGERYIVFLYRADRFTGTLLPETEEGENFWVERDELPTMDLCPNFDRYLPIFLEGERQEAYGVHGADVKKALTLL